MNFIFFHELDILAEGAENSPACQENLEEEITEIPVTANMAKTQMVTFMTSPGAEADCRTGTCFHRAYISVH